VDRRLGETTARRDADGRFRAEEFFCFDDTWPLHPAAAGGSQ